MNLTNNQFDILTHLIKDNVPFTQREIAVALNKSIGTVNKAVAELNKAGYIKKGVITNDGVAALEPYRAKRAVFIAAGFGERLVPVTLNTPKPLVRVKGVRIIDTLLDAVKEAGIEEIIIVRGYLSEQFDQLLYKYPNIKFLENPIYNETNNISSALCARYMLKNAYIFDSDLLLNKKTLITKYQYASNYLGFPVEKTDDWCLASKKGIITKMALGGINCHHMIGISYWTETDGAKLSEHIKLAYEMPGGKERLWDQVPLEYFAKEYTVRIKECSYGDVFEVDTYNELKALDSVYV